MIIKKARLDDVPEINRISLALSVPRNSKEETGFVEYQTPSEDELRRRVEASPFFYVAKDKEETLGFLAAYADKELQGLDFSRDGIVQHLLNSQRGFVYLDLLGVKRGRQRIAIGPNLMGHFHDAVGSSVFERILGSIAHEPHKNRLMINTAVNRGYKLLEEISVYEGLVFGIYEKIISS